jgi:cytoskeletal protein RodZ
LIENSNKFYYNFILFLGLLLFPIFVFSQEEQPKRVTVIVTAKEISGQKEVVQIPADNVPKNVKESVKKSVKESSPTAQKNQVEAKVTNKVNPTVTDKTKSVTTSPTVAKKTTATKPTSPSKTEVTTTTKPAEEKPAENFVRKETGSIGKHTVDTTSTTAAKIINKDNASLKPANTETIDETLSANSKKSAFSYIWIGAFLVIAGIVLGSLFGRPAFLISFVGIVFIILGVII